MFHISKFYMCLRTIWASQGIERSSNAAQAKYIYKIDTLVSFHFPN